MYYRSQSSSDTEICATVVDNMAPPSCHQGFSGDSECDLQSQLLFDAIRGKGT